MQLLDLDRTGLGWRFCGNLTTKSDTMVTRQAMLFFAGLALPAIFIVVTSYVGCNKVLAVLFLSLGVGCGGIAMAGYNVNHLDLAPPFAGNDLGWEGRAL